MAVLFSLWQTTTPQHVHHIAAPRTSRSENCFVPKILVLCFSVLHFGLVVGFCSVLGVHFRLIFGLCPVFGVNFGSVAAWLLCGFKDLEGCFRDFP